jgi:hypothetical protein
MKSRRDTKDRPRVNPNTHCAEHERHLSYDPRRAPEQAGVDAEAFQVERHPILVVECSSYNELAANGRAIEHDLPDSL